MFKSVEPKDLHPGDLVTAPYGNSGSGTIRVLEVNKKDNSFVGEENYGSNRKYVYKTLPWYERSYGPGIKLVSREWDI